MEKYKFCYNEIQSQWTERQTEIKGGESLKDVTGNNHFDV